MRSHVDDRVDGELVFSRDCPEYHVALPDGRRLVVLANHFKSKGYGEPTDQSSTGPSAVVAASPTKGTLRLTNGRDLQPAAIASTQSWCVMSSRFRMLAARKAGMVGLLP